MSDTQWAFQKMGVQDVSLDSASCYRLIMRQLHEKQMLVCLVCLSFMFFQITNTDC